MTVNPMMLYARSRDLPLTPTALLGIAASAAWAADWPQDRPYFDHTVPTPVLTPAPLLASATVGTSLYAHAGELGVVFPRLRGAVFARIAVVVKGRTVSWRNRRALAVRRRYRFARTGHPRPA